VVAGEMDRKRCKRGIGKQEQEIIMSITRSELIVFAVVLLVLIALAISPALWGTAFGQEGEMP